METRWLSESPDDLSSIAQELLAAVPEARVFGFWGGLGAGKTTLIKALCSVLGVEDPVTSPTFNLVNTYQGAEYEIHHFDFYRIKKEEEAWEIGLMEYLDSGDYCFMEWPGKIEGLLPPEMRMITLKVQGPTVREIYLEDFPG